MANLVPNINITESYHKNVNSGSFIDCQFNQQQNVENQQVIYINGLTTEQLLELVTGRLLNAMAGVSYPVVVEDTPLPIWQTASVTCAREFQTTPDAGRYAIRFTGK